MWFLFILVITNIYIFRTYPNIKMEQIMIKELTQEQKKEYEEIKSYFKYFYDCPDCHRVFGSDDILKSINSCPKCQTAKKKKTYSLRKQLTKS